MPDNRHARNTADRVPPETRSQPEREANYIEPADRVVTKLSSDSANMVKDDGDLVDSRELRAFGASEKGGLASQVQSQAAENMGATNDTVGAAVPAAVQVSPDMQSQMDPEANMAQAAEQVGSKLQTDPASIT